MLSNKQFNAALGIFGALLFASFILPYHVRPLSTYYNDALVALGVLLVISLFAANLKPTLQLPKIALLPLAIIIVVFVQLLLGVVQFDRVALPILYLLLASAAMLIGANLSSLPNGKEKICLMMASVHLLASLLSVIMQGIQITGVNATPFIMFIERNAQALRPYANVAQPNQLALLLCLGLASIWWLYQSSRLDRWTSVLLALVLLWGITLTQSRIGWIILPLFVMFCFPRRADSKSINRYLLVLLLIAYLLMVIALPTISRYLGFFSGSVQEHIGGRSERLALMQQAWHMALQHPWLGVGWFGFGAEQVKIAGSFPATIYAEHSHNLVLNLAAELGFPAAVIILCVLAWWLLQTCVLVKATRAVQFASLCFIAIFVHSMVEYPMWYAFVLIPFSLLIGMVHQTRYPSDDVPVPQAALAFCFMLGFALLLWLTVDFQRVVFGYRILNVAPGAQNSLIEKELLAKPRLTVFSDYYNYFKLTKLLPREGMDEREIDFVASTTSRFGYVHALNKLAEVYTLNGAPAKAGEVMLTLQRLHPFAYGQYFDYWKAQSLLDERYRAVFLHIPKRDSE
jgi:O-antigen ligase